MTTRKERFLFEKVPVSSIAFQPEPDLTLDLIDNQSILFVNQNGGSVEVSFDGSTVHAELNPNIGTGSLTIDKFTFNKIWFRLSSGVSTTILVQNNANIYSNLSSDVTIVAADGYQLSTPFADPFPSAGLAVGFNDGSELQYARVYDTDTTLSKEFVLGTVLRASASGGSVETGTSSNPLRTDPTGSTAQPVTDNGGSLTVDGTVTSNQGTSAAASAAWSVQLSDGTSFYTGTKTGQLPSTLIGGRLDTNTGAWLGSTAPTVGQKSSANSIPVVVSSDQSPIITEPVDWSLDAFSRLRVSSPVTLFDGKNLYGNRALDYDEALTGSATAADVANAPLRRLTVTGNATDSAIRQTKRYFAYQAGKSHQVIVTFILGAAVANVRKRVGYFDGNNGIFLQQTSADVSLVVRSSTGGSPSDSPVNQASWNIDPMDGTGPSGKILDLSKSQILYIDLEWLGVGRVRCGFVIDGKLYYAHAFYAANVLPNVYTATAALPVRWEIANTAASAGATLDCNCASVASEGGTDYPGTLTGIDRGVNVLNLSSGIGTGFRQLLGIRTQVAYTRMTVIPEKIEVVCATSSSNAFRWSLLLNPTITGGTAASWTPITNSGLEFDIARTGVVSGGYQVSSGYGFGNASSNFVQRLTSLGATIAGVRDEYVLAIQQLAGSTSEDYVGAMQIREIF